MEVVVEWPITVKVDNIVAIFLSENTFLSQQKKRIDVIHHSIYDCVKDETVKIKNSVQKKNWQIHVQRT